MWNAQEIARELNVKKFLIHLWEKEFNVEAQNAQNKGHRCYLPEQAQTFAAIKDLVVHQGLSLNKAKQKMNTATPHEEHHKAITPQESDIAATNIHGARKEESRTMQPAKKTLPEKDSQQQELFLQKMMLFKEQLIQFKQLLDIE